MSSSSLESTPAESTPASEASASSAASPAHAPAGPPDALPEPPAAILIPPHAPAPLSGLQQVMLRVVLLAAIVMRLVGLGDLPFVHYPEDEFHYVWAGLSLLHGEKATSWSWIKCYYQMPQNVLGHVRWDDHDFRFVRPAMDHPPLFSLLAGGFAMLTRPHQARYTADEGGPVDIWEVQMPKVRLLAVILFAITAMLLFTLAREAFSNETAFFALILYSFSADSLIRTRLVVTENFYVPLMLLGLLWLVRYLQGRVSRRGFALVVIATVAAALLSKLAAGALAGVLVLLLLLVGRRREALYPILGAALGLALYLAYAAWQGWDVFRAVMGSQSDRFSGFNLMLKLLVPGRSVSGEPSMLLVIGWLALFSGLLARRLSPVLLAPLLYMIGHVFFGSTKDFYEWHFIVYLPFLALGLAALAGEAWRGRDGRALLVFAVLLVPYAFEVLYQDGRAAPMLRPLYPAALASMAGVALLAPRARLIAIRTGITLCLGVALYWEVTAHFLKYLY